MSLSLSRRGNWRESAVVSVGQADIAAGEARGAKKVAGGGGFISGGNSWQEPVGGRGSLLGAVSLLSLDKRDGSNWKGGSALLILMARWLPPRLGHLCVTASFALN